LRASGRSIAVVSQKGGVGKTTLTANLAVAFQQLQFRTLVVELDPQGSLIRLFGRDRFDLHHGLFGVLTGEETVEMGIEKALVEGVHLLPANVWSHEEEIQYLDALRRNPLALREVLDPLRASYDYILMDCSPGLGSTTRAALAACDRYLVPVQAEAMNLDSLPRLEQMAEAVRVAHNPSLALEGYVVTMADTRTRHACDVILNLAKKYPNNILETVIPRSIRVAEESERGRPTVAGAPGTRVGRAFVTLSEEILSRHARHRDLDGNEASVSELDDADDPGRITTDPAEFDDLAIPVAGNGRPHFSSRVGEETVDREWSDIEDFPRD
jgi:chromosome partitioning protein